MKFNIYSKVNKAALALAVIVGFSSCDDKDDITPIQVANVGVINLLDDVAEINAHIGTTKVNSETLKFATFSKYNSFIAANAALNIFENTQTDTLASVSHNFKSNEAYSAYVIGEEEDAEIVIVTDVLTNPASGKAKIRLANFIDGAEKIDLFVGDAEEPTANDSEYKDVNNFVELDAVATTELSIRVDGEDTALASLENAKLEAGKIYTVLAYETVVDGAPQVVIKLITQK